MEVGRVAAAQRAHLIHEQLRNPNNDHRYLRFVLRLQTVEFLKVKIVKLMRGDLYIIV